MKIGDYEPDQGRPFAKHEGPPGDLVLFVEHTVVPADAAVPVAEQGEWKLCQRSVEDPQRGQVVNGDAQDLYPQTLEVLVPLAQQHKLGRSDRRESH